MYVAHYLAGRDTLLMIHNQDLRREASRRIRDDLIHLGLVDDGPTVELAEGARGSVGDLIICRKNDNKLNAGEPDRTMANGDTLRIEAIHDDGTITVRRMLSCNRETGQRRWADHAVAYTASSGSYGAGYAGDDLGDAITGHTAQGRTVTFGIPLITGGEDRQWLYVAMTRGTDGNFAFTYTRSAKIADPKTGTRQAPELDRHARKERQRDGLPPLPVKVPKNPEPRAAIAAVADVHERDGSATSASETESQGLADADHRQVLTRPCTQPVSHLSFTIAGMHSDRVQLGDGVGRQGQGRAGDVLAQVIDRRGARDQHDVRRAQQQPGLGDRDRRRA